MEKNQVSKRGLVLKYGLITVFMLIVYFAIMAVFGLIGYSALRIINYPLIALGVFLAIRELKQKRNDNNVGYLEGFSTGFVIVIFTAILFSIFVFIYARFINPNFIELIWPNPFSHNKDSNDVAFGMYTFGETLIFGVILVLIVMMFFKNDGSPESEG